MEKPQLPINGQSTESTGSACIESRTIQSVLNDLRKKIDKSIQTTNEPVCRNCGRYGHKTRNNKLCPKNYKNTAKKVHFFF